ncbi:MAG: threonine aldolase [Sphingobacteriales bacterium BACL12 MAG-120813-bin55]|jgi:threonine aldolase|nr:MAG: threonine aldolase [Sphingobacteriales bacterium BACL12 MAG-120813-bin55]
MRVDIRSDTFTQPSAGMRKAMQEAVVGDDVFQEDPTINQLEADVAQLMGTEAALFCPTATMCNQIAIKVHTQPMDEIICDRLAHIYNYEVGGYAYLSGCSIRYITTERGLLQADDILANINPTDIHKPATTLVCLENTCNKGGGSVYPPDVLEATAHAARSNGLKLHMDGSRLFNASIAGNLPMSFFGQLMDTTTLCLSKGLGCPAGALLAGSKATIVKARKIRKVLGGGMRQAGVLAAAGIYALEHQLDDLRTDHLHAAQIAEVLSQCNYCVHIKPVDSNIIIFHLREDIASPAFAQQLEASGILAFALDAGQVRFVLHRDISAEMVNYVCQQLSALQANYG